jgi:uncharacterized protein involved in response to NO
VLSLAAVARVIAPLIWPAAYVETVVIAGACWAAAFLLYFVSYLPWLTRARLDGKAG